MATDLGLQQLIRRIILALRDNQSRKLWFGLWFILWFVGFKCGETFTRGVRGNLSIQLSVTRRLSSHEAMSACPGSEWPRVLTLLAAWNLTSECQECQECQEIRLIPSGKRLHNELENDHFS